MLFIPMSPIPEKTSKQLGEFIRDSGVLVQHTWHFVCYAQTKCNFLQTMTQQFIMKELVLH